MPIPPHITRVAKEALKPKPDAQGYLGISDGSGGYIFDMPFKPGYVYARIQSGVSFEIGEAIQGGVSRDPNQKVAFQRVGPSLVAMLPNALGAVAAAGADASQQFSGDVGDQAILHTDIAPAEGLVRKTGDKAYTAIKTNFSATAAPTISDDNTEGYSAFSAWIDTVGGKIYICRDASTGAALWVKLGEGLPQSVSEDFFASQSVGANSTITLVFGGSLGPVGALAATFDFATDNQKILVTPDSAGNYLLSLTLEIAITSSGDRVYLVIIYKNTAPYQIVEVQRSTNTQASSPFTGSVVASITPTYITLANNDYLQVVVTSLDGGGTVAPGVPFAGHTRNQITLLKVE